MMKLFFINEIYKILEMFYNKKKNVKNMLNGRNIFIFFKERKRKWRYFD